MHLRGGHCNCKVREDDAQRESSSRQQHTGVIGHLSRSESTAIVCELCENTAAEPMVHICIKHDTEREKRKNCFSLLPVDRAKISKGVFLLWWQFNFYFLIRRGWLCISMVFILMQVSLENQLIILPRYTEKKYRYSNLMYPLYAKQNLSI